MALILRKISPSYHDSAFYVHLDALKAFVSQHVVTMPAASAAVLRRRVAALRAASCTFAQPGPPRFILRSSIAVMMWCLLFIFTCVNVAVRGIVGRWQIQFQLLLWTYYSWTAVMIAYLSPSLTDRFALAEAQLDDRDMPRT